MTEKEQITLQIKVLKDSIKSLKMNITGVHLHLVALERQVKKMTQKKVKSA